MLVNIHNEQYILLNLALFLIIILLKNHFFSAYFPYLIKFVPKSYKVPYLNQFFLLVIYIYTYFLMFFNNTSKILKKTKNKKKKTKKNTLIKFLKIFKIQSKYFALENFKH